LIIRRKITLLVCPAFTGQLIIDATFQYSLPILQRLSALVIRAQFEAPGMSVVLSEFNIATPVTTSIQTEHNEIALFIPPVRLRGTLRCPQLGLDEFRPARPLRFRPAGVTYELRDLCGTARLLKFSFSNLRLRDAIGDDIVWDAPAVERALDLSAARLSSLIMKLLDELTAPGIGSAALMEALSTVVIVELVRHVCDANPEVSRQGARLSRAQLARIRQRTEGDDRPSPSVTELARLCDISERNLLRLFKTSTGETVSGYIRRVQISRARRYLTTTDMPLKQLAALLGYSQSSAFIAAYRRTTAETPDQFRKRLRRDHKGAL